MRGGNNSAVRLYCKLSGAAETTQHSLDYDALTTVMAGGLVCSHWRLAMGLVHRRGFHTRGLEEKRAMCACCLVSGAVCVCLFPDAILYIYIIRSDTVVSYQQDYRLTEVDLVTLLPWTTSTVGRLRSEREVPA